MAIINKISYNTLLYILVFGFLSGLDFTDAWGCVIMPHFFFLTPLSLFTILSFGAIYSAKVSKRTALAKFILIGELVFYIFRLIFFKGGYAVGFAGSPDLIVLAYDAISILVRLILLLKVMKLKIRIIPILLLTIATLYTKSQFFPIPPYYFYQEKVAIKEGRKLQEELVGTYTGFLTYNEETKPHDASVTITKDSIFIISENYPQAGSHGFLLESKNFGYISNGGVGSSVYINEYDEDHLDLSIEYGHFEANRFKLTRK